MGSRSSHACLECSRDFLGARKQKYCSQACDRKSREKRRKTLTCNKCGKDFIAHVQSRRLKCYECKPATSQMVKASVLYADIYGVRFSGGGYNCQYCGKIFATYSGLVTHLALMSKRHNDHKITFEDYTNDKARRDWLIREHGHRCWVCNNSEWMGKPITLELDHIDGHSENSAKENLRILCPNCHAQTPTYKSKNRGNGSKARAKMYESMRLRASMPTIANKLGDSDPGLAE